MKKFKGTSKNIKQSIIGKFVLKNNPFIKNKILYCTKLPIIKYGIIAYITSNNVNLDTDLPVLKIENPIEKFNNNDILKLSSDGECSILWESNEIHNALYVTDICNSRCIMCPQVENGKSRFEECFKILDNVDLSKYEYIGITGGEPTLEFDKLVSLLDVITRKAPNCNIHILTNGRAFSKLENVKKIISLNNKNISFGIPLYSDISEEHDYIVGIRGAFNETIRGLYNLAKYKQKIEIRTVIMKQNYKKLKDIAEYIYRNLPFITHVALMTMEYHGNAETNYELISIDPSCYKEELYLAVKEFVRYNIIVDVYNTPLCLVDNRIQDFCRDSISTWKKTYLSQCNDCTKKEICSGVFETSFVHSSNIKPF